MGSVQENRQAENGWWKAWVPWWPALRGHEGMLAVAAGLWAGAAGYFSWPVELPWLPFALTLAGMALLGCAALHDGAWARPTRWVMLGLLAVGVGIGLADWQVRRAEQAFDWWQISGGRAVWVTGRLQAVTPARSNPDQVWLQLEDGRVYLPGAGEANQLEVSRLGLTTPAQRARRLVVGEGVAAQMVVFPPEGPRGPADNGSLRDYRLLRVLNHDELRGVVRGDLKQTVLPERQATTWQRAWRGLEDLRGRIGESTKAYGQGVVPALLVGDWRYIPKEVSEDYRRSGLTHLLVISGFQLTVVGLGLFFGLRWLLAWWPWLALRLDVRRLAAVLALGAVSFYSLLAGADVSVLRALAMLGLLFLAILTGRVRVLIRAWAVAVILLVLWQPSVVTLAGFQLSFAAVLALLLWGAAERAGRDGLPLWTGAAAKLRALLLSSVVAGLATLPIIALDFRQVSLVSVAANLVAEPVMALLTWLGMTVLVLWPLGWESVPVWLLGQGVDLVNRWAAWLADWPGAQVLVPAWGGFVLLGFCLVALLCLYARRWMLLMLVVCGLVGTVGMLTRWVPAYVAIIDGRGRLVRGALPVTDNATALVFRPEGGDREDCRLAGLIVTGQVQAVFCPDKTYPQGSFAWAGLRTDGRWDVARAACGRHWQRYDPACRSQPVAETLGTRR